MPKAFRSTSFTLEKVGGLPATSRQPEEILAGQTPACVSESVPLPKPDFSLPGIRQEDTVNGLAAKPFPSMRRSHVQHNTARVPRRTPFWPKPQKGAKALFPGHPAALMNEPPAPHRERQVAAKSGMLQTRSRPQSCGFRPPVLSATASWSTIFRRRPAHLRRPRRRRIG